MGELMDVEPRVAPISEILVSLGQVIRKAFQDEDNGEQKAQEILEKLAENEVSKLSTVLQMNENDLEQLLQVVTSKPARRGILRTALVRFTKNQAAASAPLGTASQATIDFWNLLPQATLTSGVNGSQKGKGKDNLRRVQRT